MQREHLGHAVEAGDLGAGAVRIRTHADAHVEPRVAVDQVVAAAAFDDVAAVAAEDDVAGREAASAPAAKQFLQTVDKAEIGERAARRAAMVEDGDRVDVVTAQDVA